jgi:hypothetical protein
MLLRLPSFSHKGGWQQLIRIYSNDSQATKFLFVANQHNKNALFWLLAASFSTAILQLM